MWKNLFGLSAVIASVAFFMQSIPAVEAHSGPVGLSYGGFGYHSFTGEVDYSTDTLMTVPADKAFVVTTAITGYPSNYYYAYFTDLLEDGVIVVEGSSGAMVAETGGVLTQGRAHMKFSPGSVISIRNDVGYTVGYYVEGYYAEP